MGYVTLATQGNTAARLRCQALVLALESLDRRPLDPRHLDHDRRVSLSQAALTMNARHRGRAECARHLKAMVSIAQKVPMAQAEARGAYHLLRRAISGFRPRHSLCRCRHNSTVHENKIEVGCPFAAFLHFLVGRAVVPPARLFH